MAERRATAERLRRDLVSDVAHELRSPLTNLRCQIEALQDGLCVRRRRPWFPPRGGRLLERLIDDLQDLALAEAGQLDLERSPLDSRPRPAVQSRPWPSSEEQDLRIEVDLPSDLPPVDADARRLAQILSNLLGNAVTHTPPGGTSACGREAESG